MIKSSLMASCGLLFALGAPLVADSLTGKVVDSQGAVVVNATVSLHDKNSGNVRNATSSATGEYSFTDIGAGGYLLEAKTSGSAMSGSAQVTVAGSATQDLTLNVARSTERVFVTATSTPIFEQEVARTIDVVDAQQIEERDEYSIGEALRTIPGVQIQTQVGGITQIRTRGLRNQDTGVLIDGLRFRDAAATQGDASGFLADMNVTDLGRAEYLRGSGSSLYGTNAIGGAVSLNSNDGGGQTRGSIRAEGGGLGFFRGTANLAGGVRNDKLVYSGGASHLNVTGGVRGKTPNKNSSGQFFGKYYFTPGLSLSGRVWGADVYQRSVDSVAFTPAIIANFSPAPTVVQGIPLSDSQLNLYEKKQPISVGNATFIPSVPDPDANRSSNFAASAFILRHDVSANTSWRASYQRVDTRRAAYDGPAGVGSFEPVTSVVSNNNGNTDQLQLRIDSNFSFHRVTGGYEFEREGFDSLAQRNQIGGAKVRTTAMQNSHSIYGQDQMHFLSDRLQIVLGGRIQKFDLNNPSFTGTTSPYEKIRITSPESAFTGDLSVAYFVPRSNTKFRGHLGNGYRAPSLYERFGSGYSSFSSSFTYYGDPRLAPEKSISFDTGIDQYFLQNKGRASATFFYTDLTESIIFPNSIPNDPFNRPFGGYANSKNGGISRGVELSTQISPTSKTSLTASYTYVNSDQRTASFGNDYYRTIRTAKDMFSMTATHWVTRKLNVTFDFYALGDVVEAPFGPFPQRLIAFAGPRKADVVANYKFTLSDKRSVDVYTKIENIGNYRYTDNGFLAPGAWGIVGMKYNF